MQKAELAPPGLTLCPAAKPSAAVHAPALSPAARLEQLMRDNLDFVWRIARRMGVPAESADDAAQQVFIIAASRIDSIAPGSERAFLFGTAVRVASDVRRSLRRRKDCLTETGSLEGPSEETLGPEQLMQRRQAGQILDRLLDAMPDDLRTPFVLFEFEEMTLPQIAQLLEIPLGTATSRLRRAREHFQTAVKQIESERVPSGGAR